MVDDLRQLLLALLNAKRVLGIIDTELCCHWPARILLKYLIIISDAIFAAILVY